MRIKNKVVALETKEDFLTLAKIQKGTLVYDQIKRVIDTYEDLKAGLDDPVSKQSKGYQKIINSLKEFLSYTRIIPQSAQKFRTARNLGKSFYGKQEVLVAKLKKCETKTDIQNTFDLSDKEFYILFNKNPINTDIDGIDRYFLRHDVSNLKRDLSDGMKNAIKYFNEKLNYKLLFIPPNGNGESIRRVELTALDAFNKVQGLYYFTWGHNHPNINYGKDPLSAENGSYQTKQFSVFKGENAFESDLDNIVGFDTTTSLLLEKGYTFLDPNSPVKADKVYTTHVRNKVIREKILFNLDARGINIKNNLAFPKLLSLMTKAIVIEMDYADSIREKKTQLEDSYDILRYQISTLSSTTKYKAAYKKLPNLIKDIAANTLGDVNFVDVFNIPPVFREHFIAKKGYYSIYTSEERLNQLNRRTSGVLDRAVFGLNKFDKHEFWGFLSNQGFLNSNRYLIVTEDNKLEIRKWLLNENHPSISEIMNIIDQNFLPLDDMLEEDAIEFLKLTGIHFRERMRQLGNFRDMQWLQKGMIDEDVRKDIAVKFRALTHAVSLEQAKKIAAETEIIINTLNSQISEHKHLNVLSFSLH